MRLREPSADAIARYRDEQRTLAYTYPGVGTTRDDGDAPAGFSRDRVRAELGRGAAAYAAACGAIRDWVMFPPWVIVEPHAPIVVDETVAVIMRLGLWWLNAARIVYVIDEPRRFGFAYGTLPGHAERGEERFLVEHRDDDTVWYDLSAFSRPRHWAPWLVYPVTRALQAKFRRDSIARMTAAARASR